MRTHSMKLILSALLLVGAASVLACQEEDPCDPGQTLGENGLCYRRPNWGESCEQIDECEGGLLCLAPDLPYCTQVNCNPDPAQDTVCPDTYTCVETGTNPATVCVPGAPTPEQCGETPDDGAGGAGGAGGAPADPGTPNPGTACSLENDPVCTGGTFCETTQLKICTVASCKSGCKNANVCSDAGMNCYEGPSAPTGGICIP
ncbi:MAG TPA: hypothetical protein VLC09_13220 [Polyangiaceae bacterium]|nr:hypothetical protein [Polyangiaceae bacterium]